MAAVRSHRLKQCRGCMELLLEAGANVDAIGFCADGSAESALIWAAAQSCCDRPLMLLLENGADACSLTPGQYGTTAMHVACTRGSLSRCKLLIEASDGRAVHLRTHDGTPVVCAAVASGQLPVIRLLLQHGADSRVVFGKGKTLLHAAASSETGVVCLPFLISKGLVRREHPDGEGCHTTGYCCLCGQHKSSQVAA
jgi:ankyrin repeat protein